MSATIKKYFTSNTVLELYEDDKITADVGIEHLIQGLSMHELFLQG